MAQSAHQSIGRQLMCINNEWIPAASEAFISVENPARKGTEAGQVPRGGKTEVGRAVMQAGAERIIPVSLELGGKNPQIVFPDADDEKTVQQVINAMRFVRQGQSYGGFKQSGIGNDFAQGLRSSCYGTPLFHGLPMLQLD